MRATLGSFSGPMTISATTPIMAILERPRSIMEGLIQTHPARTRQAVASELRFFLGVDVDRGFIGNHLGRRYGSGFVFLTLDAILESLDGLAHIGTHIAQLFGSKQQHDDDKHDHPVP